MYPLQEKAPIQYTCLLRTTQTCWYGSRPQYNQYVLMEMGKLTTFYQLDTVPCVREFRVERPPDEGLFQRMEAEACGGIP